ncbi:MAG TPA: single-stranded-DNA-specific exonuclease RecJ [Anaerolineaceae bacterium]|nr:single-stranded-DNA-specific exonuclease RecJ [Anaerolineaceae bacterium]
MERISPEADQALGVLPAFLRQILYNRGCTTFDEAARFLKAEPSGNTDPIQILGMGETVERILCAIQRDELIVVYGDYDVDGVTATALLFEVLQKMGARVREYIPNRFDEGYGLNNEALETVQRSLGAKLVITVDCGIRSQKEAEYARQLGLDLIITDHHHCSDTLPCGIAVINPKQPGDPYQDKDLAGVGLAYKLAQALLATQPVAGVEADQWLDLVALGTVADLAPLVGENRALVRRGLEHIRQGQRQGLLSLIGAAGLNREKVTAADIGFALGPRLNAAGRLESALAAFRLLTATDLFEAGMLAQQLDNQNHERQQQTRDIQARVEAMALAENQDQALIFAADPGFSQGIVGLAASRLAELYYRPAIVAYRNEEITRGSCRSIPGFHITEALDQCSELLIRHGGHAAAAGFTVRNENLPELITRMQAMAAQQLGDLSQLRRTLDADLEIPLSDLNFKMLNYLDLIQPTGYGNLEPVFVSRNLEVRNHRTVGKEKQHLKLWVSDGKASINAIAFRLGHLDGQLPHFVDLMYTFERNEYNGMIDLQLNVRDLRPSGMAE